MSSDIIAGIDIGTNTILMTIAEVTNKNITKILRDEHNIARLGENLNQTGYINTNAIERASAILSNYRDLCKEYNVGNILAVGTSAMREATNKGVVKDIFSNILNSEVKIISGEEEAFLSYLGTVDDSGSSLVIDIGGGSTEVIIGSGVNIHKIHSFKVGAVLLTEVFIKNHPPDSATIDKIYNYINKYIKLLESIDFKGNAYAVAGTPTTLATIAQNLQDFERKKVHNYVLSIEILEDILSNKLLKYSIKEIIDILKVNPRRADVITAGAMILKSLMNLLKIKRVIVSIYGLRLGVIKNFLKNN